MSDFLKCPKCSSKNIYQDMNLWICPECSQEWTESDSQNSADQNTSVDSHIRDAFGNILADGDSVTLIKDLKIKGSSSVVKVGTKVKSIRLTEESDGHNIACKVDGIGAINLKSAFVKKV